MQLTPDIRRGLSRLTEAHVVFPLVAAVLLGVIWATTLNVIGVERESAQRAAATSSTELGETYEAQVVRALREIDQTLKFVKHTHLRERGRVDLADLKRRGLLLPDLLFVVSIAGADGAVTTSSRASGIGEGARVELLEPLRERDTIVISRPDRSGGGDAVIHFARRLEDGRGLFAGMVIVSVAASYFTSGYEISRLGTQGVLGIVGADGVFRARRTGDQLAYGGSIATQALLALSSAQEATLQPNPWDGVRRFTVAREVFEFPVTVVVGLAENEQMGGARERIAAHLWRAAGGSVLIATLMSALGLLGWKLARTRERANLVLQEEVAIRRKAEAALNLRNRAVESSVNAILITDYATPGQPIEYVNPAFERITGYSAAEVIGRDTSFLFGADVGQAGEMEIRKALRERREGHAVLRNYRKDGSLFWNEYSIAPVRDAEGQVTHYVEVMNDVTEAKSYEEQLAHQANFDSLTGLANRNLLQDRLQQAMANARRTGEGLALVFLDLDNFKLVNDSLGHDVGDQLLRLVGMRLRDCVRENDTVCRQGGDEFVLILLDAKGTRGAIESGVTELMKKLLTQVSKPLSLEGRVLRPTCSIGVSLYPHDGEEPATLLRNADAAMYRAKELGRNRFQFFTAEVHERIRRRMELESSLRLALERNEFELHYQPQVDLRHGGIVGVEALIRWRHPERGLVPPKEFIAFAEETGLIVPIGEWVLREACRRNRSWQEQGLARVPVAVNMSALQCEQADIVDVVRRALEDSGLEPRYLELEITESISMANPEQSVPLMQRLKETGVILSIDDFGTGFSNLSYLRRFPVDRLKIDLSFVREIATDPGSLAISEAIITMSHNLKLHVVAEGVETAEQLALLGARDCDSMQGYFFSPPVPHEQLEQLLREGRRLAVAPGGRLHRAPALVM